MQRSIVNALPTPATPAVRPGHITRVASRPVPRWLLVFGFWTLIVLAYSTRGEVRLAPSEWVPISWLDAFKAAVAQWYSWGVMSVAIYWVNRKLPLAKDALLPRLFIHVPLSIVFTIAYTYLYRGVTVLLGAPNDPNWVGATILETASHVTYRLGTFVYWAIAMICVALDYQSNLKDREIRTAVLERLLSEARLATLRSQLDPHFLFNTLNSISAYVESAPRQARLMIEQLGDLLRLSLDHADQQEIPLERELTFVDRYIQLQLVRFADRLDVQVRVDPEVMTAAVPTFGILIDEFGLDSSKVTWVVDDEEHVTQLQLPSNVVHAPDGKSLADMMASGELVAGFQGNAGVGRTGAPTAGWQTVAAEYPDLLPDAEDLEPEWYRRTGIYPVHGTIVVKDSVLKEHPWVARQINLDFHIQQEMLPFDRVVDMSLARDAQRLLT
jgi:Histidine kinase